MRPSSRFVLLVAALSLGLLYVFPLWHIGLKAPQYPEGIGLYIELDHIRGQNPNDLNSINGLNHYIGMKKIDPDAIPELKLMPWVLRLLILGGLAAAASGRRGVLLAWVVVFAVSSLAGMADFWWWSYDYGHDLDPTAAIKVPGMSYQPPLIGTKQLLNFQATSWPALGGLIAMAALLVATTVLVLETRRARRAPAEMPA